MSDYNDGILPEPCLRMDTHFGDEYESIEFGDGTGYIKAAPILAKVGSLHEEIDRLREDVKKYVKMPDEPLEIDEKDFYVRAFIEYDDGNVLRLFDLTPAQAVDAALGRETCEILGYDDGYDEGLDGEMYQYADPRYFLSCEHEAYGSVAPNYCPVCGRKVVDV